MENEDNGRIKFGIFFQLGVSFRSLDWAWKQRNDLEESMEKVLNSGMQKYVRPLNLRLKNLNAEVWNEIQNALTIWVVRLYM